MGCKQASLTPGTDNIAEEYEWSHDPGPSTPHLKPCSTKPTIGPLTKLYRTQKTICQTNDSTAPSSLRTASNSPGPAAKTFRPPHKPKQVVPQTLSEVKSESSLPDPCEEGGEKAVNFTENSWLESAPFAVSPVRRRSNRALIEELMREGLIRETSTYLTKSEYKSKKKNAEAGTDPVLFHRRILPLSALVW